MAAIDDLLSSILGRYQGAATPPDKTDAGSNDTDTQYDEPYYQERTADLASLIDQQGATSPALAALAGYTGQRTPAAALPTNPAPQAGASPASPASPASSLNPTAVAAQNQQLLGGYQNSIQDWLKKMTSSNQDIGQGLDAYQQKMAQYQDPTSIPNLINQQMRVQQAAAATAPARYTTMGSVLHNWHPDVSGATNAIAQMVGDNQQQSARSQSIDTQNFQNWLNQQVRGQGVDTQNLANQKDLAGMGISANDRLAQVQMMADYKNEQAQNRKDMLAIAAGKNQEADPLAEHNQQTGLQRYDLVNVVAGNPAIVDTANQAAQVAAALKASGGDWKSAVASAIAPNWTKAYQEYKGEDANSAMMGQLKVQLKGILSTLPNSPGVNPQYLSQEIDSGDISRVQAAANIINSVVQNAKSWGDQMAKDRQAGATGGALLGRLAQYPSTASVAPPTARPSALAGGANAASDAVGIPHLFDNNGNIKLTQDSDVQLQGLMRQAGINDTIDNVKAALKQAGADNWDKIKDVLKTYKPSPVSPEMPVVGP